jgi:NADPH-dependent 2,4-dienoyl-CoA reductase/sulfur reductase-like enzyme/pSer/pThr/pTyr-binding forkhead associated (FHA) protein
MAEEQKVPTYLVIGNGIAGATAAEILRAEDSAATVGVIADDPSPVYYRPALKDYLGGRISEDKLSARSTSFYQDHMIRFLPERVVGIQPTQHRVQLQNGRQLSYNRLLLANGARPARLNCPGQQLQGVYTLRNVGDYQALLQNLNETRHVVVIGSGTLALETVETLRHRNYSVTHILRRRTIWSEVLDATASDLVLQQERRDGVDVRLEEEVVEIFGSQGSVNGVITRSGEQIACETVIIAIGIEPIIDFIKASGIACGRGVRIDNRMRTNTVDIYAAGDVVETTDQLTGRTRVLGQWYPAVQQARAAAYSMLDLLDNNVSFQASTFYNATFLYGLDFASVGITNAPGYQEIVAEPRPRIYRKVLLKDGIPVGMLSLGNRKQALTFKRAIDHRVNLLPVVSVLFEDSFKLNEWLDRQGVPPPLLSVSRAGDEALKRVAYPEGVSTNTALEQQPLAEALLVPIDQAPGQSGEMLLSQTKILTVGRQAGVQLLIDEATVSRRQAEISYLNGQYILHDLGSSNGTFVNDVRLEPSSTRILKTRDVVRFGKVVKFSFVMRTIDKQVKKIPESSPSLAGIPDVQEAEASVAGKLGQPVLKPDGSLLLPGARMSLSARVVATFKESAAFIVLTEDTTQESKRPPIVFLLNDEKRMLVGREEGMDIELADPVVSRQHAEVFPGPAGFYIRDLSSSNGVLVNQTRIDNPYRLSHGDHVSIGGCMLYFIDLRTIAETMVRAPLPQVSEKIETSRRPVANATRNVQQNMAQAREKTELRPQGASPPAQRKREPVTSRQLAKQDSSKSASLPQLVVCSKCGGVNTRIARFCASCSAPLGSMI